MSGKRVRAMMIWFGVGVVVFCAFITLKASHPNQRFVSLASAISLNPEAQVGERFDLSTYPPDQVFLGHRITSKDVERHIMDAYYMLKGRLPVKPVTYYSPCGDMPTQETIWQYSSFFIRLYVTSALECDGAEVAVIQGSYQEFRGERLSPECEEHIRFVEIPFESPARFLADR